MIRVTVGKPQEIQALLREAGALLLLQRAS